MIRMLSFSPFLEAFFYEIVRTETLPLIVELEKIT